MFNLFTFFYTHCDLEHDMLKTRLTTQFLKNELSVCTLIDIHYIYLYFLHNFFLLKINQSPNENIALINDDEKDVKVLRSQVNLTYYLQIFCRNNSELKQMQ